MSEVCSVCNWTNHGCLNVGNHGKPKWMCHGCIKRSLDTLQSKLTEMDQMLEWASEQRVTLYPAHMEWFFGSTKHHAPTLYAALKSAWEGRDK